MNVVAFDASNHKILLNKAYDTYAVGSNEMITDLNKLPKYSIITVAVKDEASKKLSI